MRMQAKKHDMKDKDEGLLVLSTGLVRNKDEDNWMEGEIKKKTNKDQICSVKSPLLQRQSADV